MLVRGSQSAFDLSRSINGQEIPLEEINENYEPSEQEILEYATWLGMDVKVDEGFFWIAREGLKAPLPQGWTPCKNRDGEVYYLNFSNGKSTWDHPCDEKYRQKFKDEKAKKDRDKATSQTPSSLARATSPQGSSIIFGPNEQQEQTQLGGPMPSWLLQLEPLRAASSPRLTPLPTLSRKDPSARSIDGTSQLPPPLRGAGSSKALLPAKDEVQDLSQRLLRTRQELSRLSDAAQAADARAAGVEEQLRKAMVDLAASTTTQQQLQQRLQCMSGNEEALSTQSQEVLESLARTMEAALPRIRNAIMDARVAAARSEAVESAQCAVCLEAPRDTFLNCGHIICRGCAERLERCPICRALISNRSRAFV